MQSTCFSRKINLIATLFLQKFYPFKSGLHNIFDLLHVWTRPRPVRFFIAETEVQLCSYLSRRAWQGEVLNRFLTSCLKLYRPHLKVTNTVAIVEILLISGFCCSGIKLGETNKFCFEFSHREIFEWFQCIHKEPAHSGSRTHIQGKYDPLSSYCCYFVL